MSIWKTAALALTATTLLNGCASTFGIGGQEFSCKGLPEGTRCMSAREVYAATEHVDRITNGGTSEGKSVLQTAGAKAPDGSAATLSPSRNDPVPAIDRPIPIRTQAQVMRIWISPWEDKEGDLHASEFVYTEVVARKWNVGDMQIMTGNGALSPLTGDGSGKVTMKSPLSVNGNK